MEKKARPIPNHLSGQTAGMRIGGIKLDNPTIFAPLAGITNLPMRLLAKSTGCALVYSEMISANGLVYGAAKTCRMLASTPGEKPLVVQLFGSDPAVVADAAKLAEAAGADIVDINFGCAVKKILKSGSGVALMREPQKASALIHAVRAAINIPLTIKIRSGWAPSGDEAMALARIAQDSGVDAVAIHPRTAKQAFTGIADWSLIAKIKATLTIPVIGNGDIFCAEDATRMISETGCDAVMVGRAAIGNPYIFSQIRDRMAGLALRSPTFADRFQIMLDYVNASVDYLGETTACYTLRSRLGWFAKGMPQASQFRHAIRYIHSRQQARELILNFQQSVMERETKSDHKMQIEHRVD